MPLERNVHKFLHKKIISILYSVFIINDSCKHYLDFLITHLVHCKLLKDFNQTSKNIKKGSAENNKNKLKIFSKTCKNKYN